MAARWQRGTFRIGLKNGQELVLTGGLRLTVDERGYATDYETLGADEVVMLPAFTEVVFIVKVTP